MSLSKVTCCIRGCSNTPSRNIGVEAKVKFYRFPVSTLNTVHITVKRNQWINAVKNYVKNPKDWEPTKNTRICSAHFIDNKKSENPTHPSYLPSIFPGDVLTNINISSNMNEIKVENIDEYHSKGIVPLSIKNEELILEPDIKYEPNDEEESYNCPSFEINEYESNEFNDALTTIKQNGINIYQTNIKTECQHENSKEDSESNYCIKPEFIFLDMNALDTETEDPDSEDVLRINLENSAKSNDSHVDTNVTTQCSSKVYSDTVENHANKLYACGICREQFSSKDTLLTHMGEHREYSIENCDMIEHMQTCHKNNLFECEACEKTFSGQDAFIIHMRLHSGGKSYICYLCNDHFISKESFNVHIRSHAGENSYHCKICQTDFVLKCTLDEHMRTHTEQKVFPFGNVTENNKTHECNICNKILASKVILNEHMKTHTGIKLHECSVCNKKFSNKCVFDTHMRTHTGEKPYQCSICRKNFARRNYLSSHLRTHIIEDPYQCNICYLRFTEKTNLKIHMHMHTGKKLYQCNICQKKITNKGNLKDHMKIHTGEKPFECNICQDKFIRKCYLTNHMRLHTGEKPYECNVCAEKFILKPQLTRHMLIHNIS